jgi:hypothetical protein
VALPEPSTPVPSATFSTEEGAQAAMEGGLGEGNIRYDISGSASLDFAQLKLSLKSLVKALMGTDKLIAKVGTILSLDEKKMCTKIGVPNSLCKLIPSGALADVQTAAMTFGLNPLKVALGKINDVVDDVIDAMPVRLPAGLDLPPWPDPRLSRNFPLRQSSTSS